MKTKSTTKSKKRRPAKPRVVRQKKPPKLRGLLPTPPEVTEFVEKEATRLPMTDEFKRQMTSDFTLDYYFGGEVVVARYTPEGVEALAVGLDELGEFIRSKLSEDPSAYTVVQPDYWQ